MLLSFQALAQNLVLTPECAVYDSVRNRYLISCLSVGRIVAIDSNGHQSYFKTGLGTCLSGTISGNTFYISTGRTVKGFNLATGNQVMSVYIPSSHQLDGMTTDDAGNLYVADFHYGGTDDQIFKINLSTQAYWPYVPPGQGLSEAPQDISYDRQNNRLVVVHAYNNTPIQGINLNDSSVHLILATTTVSSFDGIEEDIYGSYYVTAFGLGAVYKFDHAFANPPVLIADGFNGCSNLGYNRKQHVLAIPVYYSDTVIFHQLPLIGIEKQNGQVGTNFLLRQNYPNPFNPSTSIEFDVPKLSFVTVSVYDVLGKEIAQLLNREMRAGRYKIEWNGTGFSTGAYFCKLTVAGYSETRKMILEK